MAFDVSIRIKFTRNRLVDAGSKQEVDTTERYDVCSTSSRKANQECLLENYRSSILEKHPLLGKIFAVYIHTSN